MTQAEFCGLLTQANTAHGLKDIARILKYLKYILLASAAVDPTADTPWSPVPFLSKVVEVPSSTLGCSGYHPYPSNQLPVGYQPYPGPNTPLPPNYTPSYGATTVTVHPQEIIIVGACPACRVLL
uniref:Uncharacterized protein n=1 Tax=Timema shepardi TaxID=629360 RepID=A0A7R9B6D4_TIMSH|nr:unnamed protein product [Timema shepardi]